MIRRLHVLLLAVLALGLVAASAGREYKRTYEDATRELILYKGFATSLILRGTYLSPPFRDALAEERRRLMDATPENHAAYVARMDEDGARYHEVVFSADSVFAEGHRFGKSDEGWVLRLDADGTDEAMVTCQKVRKPNPLHRTLYPHFNQWSELWIARFARTVQDPDVVVLHVGSGFGHGELRWESLRSR